MSFMQLNTVLRILRHDHPELEAGNRLLGLVHRYMYVMEKSFNVTYLQCSSCTCSQSDTCHVRGSVQTDVNDGYPGARQ